MGIIILDRVKTCPNHQNVRNMCIYIYNITISKVNKQLNHNIFESYQALLPLRMSCHNPPEDAVARRQGLVPSPANLDFWVKTVGGALGGATEFVS